MKFSKTLVAIFAMSAFFSSAQNVEITNGAPFQMNKRGESVEEVLNQDRSDFSFLTKQGTKKFRVISLDESLAMDLTNMIDLPEVNNKEVKYIGAGKIGETTYFFSQYFDRKEKSMTLFASDLDLKTGKFNKHYEAIKIQDDGFGFLQRPFSVVPSSDSTKIMFVCVYPAKAKENARVAIRVTDNELNKVWENDIVFDQENRDFTIMQFLTDSKGNIHMAVSNRLENKEKKERGSKGRYYVSLYSYFHESEEIKEYEIGFREEVIISANMQMSEENEILCTGFYGERKVFDAGMKGFFFLRINPDTKEVVAKELSAFDTNFLKQLMNDRRAEKGKGLNNYLVRATYPLSNGGMAVVSEEYIYDRYENENQVVETWLYGNVLVFFLNPNGSMETYSILKKKQMCVDKNSTANWIFSSIGLSMYPGVTELPYYGIATMEKDDKIYLLYNENPKNEERVKADKNPKSVRQNSSVTMLMTFDKDGTISGDVLFKSKDKDAGYRMPLMPRYHFVYANDAMVVVGKKGKNARVVDVKVED